MTPDERALLISRVAERVAEEVHALYKPLLDSYLEQIAALEHELDLAMARIDGLTREEEHAEF